MRYELGLMDMYPIEASGSVVENDPMFKAVLKEDVDPVKLEDAVYRALRFHPLFGTQVEFDGMYYLTTNNRPIRLINAKEADRPKQFGRSTNGFPWQMCWSGREITLEWCHGVTDGKGALDFLTTVLSMYCGVKYPDVPRHVDLGLGLEPFFDRKEKGIGWKEQPSGFPADALPLIHRGYKAECHVIKGSTAQLLKTAKENGGSPVAVLAILLSKAIRKHLPQELRNRNVATEVAVDLRKAFGYETQHNCVEFMKLTYQDRHDEMGFSAAVRDFKAVLDHDRIRENVVRRVTERIMEFRLINRIPGRTPRKKAMALLAKLLKRVDCNADLTYIGRCAFPQEVLDQIEDFHFRVWPDFGGCIMAAIDFNGVFNINFSENFYEKGIAEDFVQLCREHGMDFAVTDCFEFEQGQFIEETAKDRKNRTYGEQSETAARHPGGGMAREIPVGNLLYSNSED